MNPFDESKPSREIFRLEINDSKEFPNRDVYHILITIMYFLGFFILIIPIIVFFYLMFISSYKTFLYGSLLFKILGGVGMIIAVILMTLIGISSKRFFPKTSENRLRTFLFILIVTILIIIVFIIEGFILYHILLSSLNSKTEPMIVKDSIVKEVKEDNDLDHKKDRGASVGDSYTLSDRKVHDSLSLYTGEDNREVDNVVNIYKFEDLIESISKNPILKDIPRSGSIKISFFSEKNGKEIIDKSFIFTTDPELIPDIELFINSEYIGPITEDLCSGIKKARSNNAVKFKLNKSNLILFTKYSNLMKYKDCFIDS